MASQQAQRFPQVVDEALQSGEVNLGDLVTYAANDDPDTLAYTVFGEDVQRLMCEHSKEIEAAATARLWWFVALAGVAILVAGLVAWLVSDRKSVV